VKIATLRENLCASVKDPQKQIKHQMAQSLTYLKTISMTLHGNSPTKYVKNKNLVYSIPSLINENE